MMQSPFPGMDPYLENPDLWRDVHNSLIVYIRAALTPQLPAGFSARLEEALYIAPRTELRPDVSLLRTSAGSSPSVVRPNGVTTLERPVSDPALLVEQEAEEIVRWIAIRDLSANELVTAIEVLSLTNKQRGPGRDKYLRKRRRFINTSVNVLEIDLLRAGPYTLGAPQARLREQCRHWDYLVSLYRACEPDRFETWPRTLQERLPTVNVPLRPEYDDLTFDLQNALKRAYEEGGFERNLDYTQAPPALRFPPKILYGSMPSCTIQAGENHNV